MSIGILYFVVLRIIHLEHGIFYTIIRPKMKVCHTCVKPFNTERIKFSQNKAAVFVSL